MSQADLPPDSGSEVYTTDKLLWPVDLMWLKVKIKKFTFILTLQKYIEMPTCEKHSAAKLYVHV